MKHLSHVGISVVPVVLALTLLSIPSLLFSQYIVEPGYHISYLIKESDVKRTDSLGIWLAKGGFDINKNGKKEIVMVSDPILSGGSTPDSQVTVFWLENDGSDKYKYLWSYKIPYNVIWASYRGYSDVQVADVDKDGNQEIWVTIPTVVNASNPDPPRLFAFEYDGTKMPTEPTGVWDFGLRDNMVLKPHTLIIDDVDNDNDVEIMMISRRDSYGGATMAETGRTFIIGVMTSPLEQGSLNFFDREFIDTSAYLKGGGLFDMEVVDYDGDGKKEIWIFTWDKYTVNIFEAKAANQYTHEVEIRQAIPNDYLMPQGDLGSQRGARFYDVNNDGKLEAFIAGCAGEGTDEDGAVLFMNSTTDVSKLTKSDVKILGYRVSGNDPIGAAIGDFDKDGKMDFAFVDRWLHKVIHLEYKGVGNPADSTSYVWTTLFQDTSTTVPGDYVNLELATSDMDGDGYPELILSNLDILDPSFPMVVVLEAVAPGEVARSNNLVPEMYSLRQNYPNPFNPETQIEFSLPRASKVSILVYDLLGEEVSDLIDEDLNPGNYNTKFNASNLSSGVYYYVFKAVPKDGAGGTFVETRKMIVVK